jgi:hypothetical protein
MFGIQVIQPVLVLEGSYLILRANFSLQTHLEKMSAGNTTTNVTHHLNIS